jgi:hypothetical protein
MSRRYLFAFIVLAVLGLASGCQSAAPTLSPLPSPAQPSPFPLTATLLPTVTLEPAPYPTPSATLTLTPTLPSPRAPTAAPPPACQNSSATITSPAMDSQVADIVEVRGTATHPIMLYWKVEYRTDGNTNYAMVSNGDAPITNDVLARLSTKTLPNGVYWLRLTVVQKDGNYPAPCEIRITITNP